MKYQTINELHHFRFADAYIAEITRTGSSFLMALDNVTILPENSCNRDIREMRTNGMELRISDATELVVVEEGYKVYDANGALLRREEDRVVAQEDYKEVWESLAGCVLYSIEKTGEKYTFSIDTEDHTFLISVSGSGDTEGWNRFLSKTE